MAEWLNAAVLKTVVRDERTVGSNPTPAAIKMGFRLHPTQEEADDMERWGNGIPMDC